MPYVFAVTLSWIVGACDEGGVELLLFSMSIKKAHVDSNHGCQIGLVLPDSTDLCSSSLGAMFYCAVLNLIKLRPRIVFFNDPCAFSLLGADCFPIGVAFERKVVKIFGQKKSCAFQNS